MEKVSSCLKEPMNKEMTPLPVRTRHCDALISKIEGFRRDDKSCDVDIHVGDKVFKCHRIILSAASEHFDEMFKGMCERSAQKEVTLSGIEANVFETILEFTYTGDAVIHNSDVCEIIRAADFYGLPLMVEFCAEFVKENLNALAEDILKIYSLAHRVRCTQLVELLSGHIYRNFRYFSGRPEYSELTYDGIMKVLDHTASVPPGAHDVHLEGIHVWINHQEFPTPTKRRECFNNLTARINFAQLSVEYTGSKLRRCMRKLVCSQSMDSDDEDDMNSLCLRYRPLKEEFLHAYVSRNSENGSPLGVSIFTAYLKAHISSSVDRFTWVYSGELGRPVDFMRNVFIDGRSYSLRYLKENRPQQTFCSGSSILMYPSLALKLPPCILDEFDMCGVKNDIYVYNKNILPIPIDTEYSGFSEEDLRRGMYHYKRDIDRWFPIPSPETRFINACMTCDFDGMAYLIGGRNSNRSANVYDPRTGRWSALSPTIGKYDGAACCTGIEGVYVAGGIHNSTMVETYVCGKWIRLKDLPEPRKEQFQLMNWYPQFEDTYEVLTYNRKLLPNSRILCPNSHQNLNCWFPMPNLFAAVKRMDLTFTNLDILDMINFIDYIR